MGSILDEILGLATNSQATKSSTGDLLGTAKRKVEDFLAEMEKDYATGIELNAISQGHLDLLEKTMPMLRKSFSEMLAVLTDLEERNTMAAFDIYNSLDTLLFAASYSRSLMMVSAYERNGNFDQAFKEQLALLIPDAETGKKSRQAGRRGGKTSGENRQSRAKKEWQNYVLSFAIQGRMATPDIPTMRIANQILDRWGRQKELKAVERKSHDWIVLQLRKWEKSGELPRKSTNSTTH